MNTGYVEIVAGTGGIVGMDIDATIDRSLHVHSPELGHMLKEYVQELTPIRTGALIMDISYRVYPFGSNEIVLVYAENIAQEAFWNRIYVQYQEGGLLGTSTYTNDPHEMFFRTAVGDGLALTEAWAEMCVAEAIGFSVAGTGVPI